MKREDLRNKTTLSLTLSKGERIATTNLLSNNLKSLFKTKTVTSLPSYPPALLPSKRKTAFTLAEVLITLGIIGVVAALTMPALIQNYRKHVVETKLAKVYSVMNQAIKMVSAEYGEPADWMRDCGHTLGPTCTLEEVKDWFDTYLGKYLNGATGKIYEDSGFRVYFNDGSILIMTNAIYDMNFYIDENALNTPKSGINVFAFRFNPLLKNQDANINIMKSNFEPYNYAWNGQRSTLFTKPGYGCNNGGAYCAKLIQMNGWKVPKDYPHKF